VGILPNTEITVNEVIKVAAKRIDVGVPGKELGVTNTVTCGDTFASV
jgi:hypothetical protein